MKEVVLLTGALGNVGRTILSHLHDQYTWRLLDNQSPDSDFPYDVIVADILNTTAVNEAVEGASAIIHLAGDPQTSASWKSVLRNNIEGTQILLEAAAPFDDGMMAAQSAFAPAPPACWSAAPSLMLETTPRQPRAPQTRFQR